MALRRDIHTLPSSNKKVKTKGVARGERGGVAPHMKLNLRKGGAAPLTPSLFFMMRMCESKYGLTVIFRREGEVKSPPPFISLSGTS